MPASGRIIRRNLCIILMVLTVLCSCTFGKMTYEEQVAFYKEQYACIYRCGSQYGQDVYDTVQLDNCISDVCGQSPDLQPGSCTPKDADLDDFECEMQCITDYGYLDESPKTYECLCNKCQIQTCCGTEEKKIKNHPPILSVEVKPEKPFVGGPLVSDYGGKQCLAIITAVGQDEEDGNDLDYKFSSSALSTGGDWDPDNTVCIPPNSYTLGYIDVVARDLKGALSNTVTVIVDIENVEDIDNMDQYQPVRKFGENDNKGQGEVTSDWGGAKYEAFYVPDGITWADAKAAAESKGGYLVSIGSVIENRFVYSLVQDDKFWNWDGLDGNGPWVGGYQKPGSSEPAGGWIWVNGLDDFSRKNWGSGEPNNGGQKAAGVEDCLAFIGKGTLKGDKWNDKPCSTKEKGYIVEWWG
jgi:hypothetical protein